MRKKVFGRQLGRDHGSRVALRRSLVRSMALDGSIKTTLTKAKFIQPEIDRIISHLSKNERSKTNKVMQNLANNREVVKRLMAIANKLTADRKSGFTRIIKLSKRRGDNVQMARLEWVEDIAQEKKENKKRDKKSSAKQKKKEKK